EGRREQLDQACVVAYEVVLDCLHRLFLALRVACTGDDAPALRDRVDAALLGGSGAEWRAVVEVRAPVPLAVPAMRFRGDHVRVRPLQAVAVDGRIAAFVRDRAESAQRGDQKPAEPDALALPFRADTVHAVVPVAGTDERQAARTDGACALQCAHTMIVDARSVTRGARQVVDVVL